MTGDVTALLNQHDLRRKVAFLHEHCSTWSHSRDPLQTLQDMADLVADRGIMYIANDEISGWIDGFTSDERRRLAYEGLRVVAERPDIEKITHVEEDPQRGKRIRGHFFRKVGGPKLVA